MRGYVRWSWVMVLYARVCTQDLANKVQIQTIRSSLAQMHTSLMSNFKPVTTTSFTRHGSHATSCVSIMVQGAASKYLNWQRRRGEPSRVKEWSIKIMDMTRSFSMRFLVVVVFILVPRPHPIDQVLGYVVPHSNKLGTMPLDAIEIGPQSFQDLLVSRTRVWNS